MTWSVRTLRWAVLPLVALPCLPVAAGTLVPPLIEMSSATDTSVKLGWSESPALRGRTNYTVNYCVSADVGGDGEPLPCVPGTRGVSTKSLQATVDELGPETVYFFQVKARDSGGNEATSLVHGPVTTCAASGCDNGGGSSCDYPTFNEPNLTTRDKVFDKPAWATVDTNIVFDERFDGATTESWLIETMEDPLNQSGNAGINEFGNACGDCRPRGKRWSAWSNGNWDLMIGGYGGAFEEVAKDGIVRRVTGIGDGGTLALGGVREEGAVDPTRPGDSLVDPTQLESGYWNGNRLYAPWIKTWARTPPPDPMDDTSQAGNTGESTLNVPGKDQWTWPMYLEAEVDFSQMTTPGFRLSMWLMPATEDGPGSKLATGTEAYDGDFDNGFEIDIFEYEPWTPECKELLEFSWINSFSGPSKGKRAKLKSGKTHLRGVPGGDYEGVGSGPKTVGLLWERDRLQWVYQGDVVLEITDAAKIPDIHQYLIISREMTNGLTTENIVPTADGSGYVTYLPAEGGLYGYSGRSNIGTYLDRINDDRALVNYVRVYKPIGGN